MLVRDELQGDREARLGGLAVLVLRDREAPAGHLRRDARVDLVGEALRAALHGAAGLVDRQRQRDLAARARVLVQVLLVAALEAGHVRRLDLLQHDVGRQRRLVERLLVGDRDAAGRALLDRLAGTDAIARRAIRLEPAAGADARVT